MKKIVKVVLVISCSLVLLVLVAVGGIYWHAHAAIRDGVSTLKRAVVQDFNDPESARFRSIELRSLSGTIRQRLGEFDTGLLREHGFKYVKALLTHDPDMFQLCGEVNARNAFGAYVGYRKFWISGVGGIQEATPFIAAQDDDDFPEQMCKIGKEEPAIYAEG